MNKKRFLSFVAGLLFLLAFVPAASAAEEAAGLVETRPVLPASGFKGRAEQAYRIAGEIPRVLDKLYCYCNCKENPTLKHKTLLTCYTNDHASKCDICMREAEIADEMTKQGKPVDEVRAAVDKYGEEKKKEAQAADVEKHPHGHRHGK